MTSNGILIVSKLPIKYVDHIVYQKGVNEDGWAAKGCTLIEVEKEGVVFQLTDTHLQSENSDEAVQHRHSQYGEIKTLLESNKKENIPVLVVGDMNTRKTNNPSYNKMLKTIGVIDFPLNETEPFAIDSINYWNSHNKGIQLDYILLNNRGTRSTIAEQFIIRPKKEFKGEKSIFLTIMELFQI